MDAPMHDHPKPHDGRFNWSKRKIARKAKRATRWTWKASEYRVCLPGGARTLTADHELVKSAVGSRYHPPASWSGHGFTLHKRAKKKFDGFRWKIDGPVGTAVGKNPHEAAAAYCRLAKEVAQKPSPPRMPEVMVMRRRTGAGRRK